MRWQLTAVGGQLGEISAAQALAKASKPMNEQGQAWMCPPSDLPVNEGLWARLQPLLDPIKPNWIILPHGERVRRDWWQGQLNGVAELGFGRAAVALALSQLNRLAVPGRFIALDRPLSGEPGIEAELTLDWTPAHHGLGFELNQMDGRLDGKTDVGALLELGRSTLPQPEVLFCPGTGSDGYLERLLPFFSALGPWSAQEVRWEFAEAAVGRLGVVGSLFNWAWLEAGYRLGDWAGPCAVLELDESPLAGLSVVNWAPGYEGGPVGLT